MLGLTALEHGTYRNHFHAAPAAAPVVPRFVRKPTAQGLQTAVAVGVAGSGSQMFTAAKNVFRRI